MFSIRRRVALLLLLIVVNIQCVTMAVAQQAPPVATGAATAATGAKALPRELSPWGMFVNADKLVKLILLGLTFASIVTWTVWLAKSIELFAAKRRAQQSLDQLMAARTLTEVAPDGAASPAPVERLIAAAIDEMARSGSLTDREGIKERIALSLQRIEASAGREMMRGTGVLATIGATAPFVGLFGTVWGIMNAFVGIARMQTTNLAVVAPGIAEALLATAVGLAAAIPAVVIYNVFARAIAGYRALIADASAQTLRLASRDLDFRAAGLGPDRDTGYSRRAAE